MFINRITLVNFRNFENITFYPSNDLNILVGSNGSGKTSILESIHYMSLARSFRTSNNSSIVHFGEKSFVIASSLLEEKGEESFSHKLAISRELSGKLQIKFDNESVRRISTLANNICVQLISPTSLSLIDGTPSLRREFIDWGCFYHFPEYTILYQRFQKILKQRNAVLQLHKPSEFLSYWNDQFIKASLQINEYRDKYLKLFNEEAKLIISHILPQYSLSITLSSGFKTSREEFVEQLNLILPKELQLGYTLYGPQKSDIKIKAEKRLASELLSRGQQKLLLISLRLAQGLIYEKYMNKNCIFLIDDFSSELDDSMQHVLYSYLFNNVSNSQFFITSLSDKLFSSFSSDSIRVNFFKIDNNTIIENNNT